MIRLLSLVVLFSGGFVVSVNSQTDTTSDGYKIFYYPSGQKASEGTLKNGKPDGLWISFYPTGIKKSEGKRKNFLLDSTWIFFNQLGDTAEKIEYLLGKKNGYTLRFGYRNDRIGKDKMILLSKELYLNDKLEGSNYYYYPSGRLREIVKYRDGKKDGTAFEYSPDSVIIAARDYRRDFLVQSERMNRNDSLGKKQGLWREYFPDGKIKTEGYYRDGVLSGIFKQFNEKGALELALNYRDGVILDNVTENQKEVSIRNKYDENNLLVFSGAFIDSIPVGIHRFYNSSGEVVDAKVYSNSGLLLSQGIINNDGKRQGKTTFFFETGKPYAIGDYQNNLRTGKWIYYYKSGRIEQEGNFRNDLADGSWKWYYPDGEIKREEEFIAGKEDGPYVEYDLMGNVITKGNCVEGEKEGEWEYKVGDHSEIGKYVTGLRDGSWKYYYGNGGLQFEGTYIQGNLDGQVHLYYPGGQLMEEQYYSNGLRQKTWKKYDTAGALLLSISYKDDQEIRINGEKIELGTPDVKLIK
jgi:uncharacterized protein